MKKIFFKQVVIVGVGLIGGSIGRDLLKKKFAKKVVGIDANDRALAYAKKNKIISEKSRDDLEVLATSDLVVFATPVCTILDQIKDFSPFISDKTLVIDVGSTKTDILKVADRCFQEGNFVGCHPMAGSEKSGAKASMDDLFQGAPCLVVGGKKTKTSFITKAKRMWRSLGGCVEEVSPSKHDKWLAACSHLPHALSFALMESVGKKTESKELKKIAGKSFKSYTRVAGSNARMWTDIFVDNKENTLKQIHFFQKELSNLEKAIKKSDEKWLLNYIDKTAKMWREM